MSRTFATSRVGPCARGTTRSAALALLLLGSGAVAAQDDDAPCLLRGPPECPEADEPRFLLRFQGRCVAPGDPGAEVAFDIQGQLVDCAGPEERGPQAWSIGVSSEYCRVLAATTRGTVAAPVSEGGLRDQGFELTEVIDPSRNGGKDGAVSAVALSFTKSVTLEPGSGPHDILRMSLYGSVPTDGQCPACVLRYTGGLRGAGGQPVRNTITVAGVSHEPESGDPLRISLCPIVSGGLQRPLDANQDGHLDVSDPIFVLGHLFVGDQPELPCGDHTVYDPANVTLLDSNGDGLVDVSDCIHVLGFLFLEGPEPVLGTTCMAIEGCPSACRK